MIRLRILLRWASYMLGLRPANGLKKFHLAWDRHGALLWADNPQGIPVLLASTSTSSGFWPGEISSGLITKGLPK